MDRNAKSKIFWRQLGIWNPSDFPNVDATIIGCGSIGSYLALTLGKMGLSKLVLYDDDYVDAHNLPNQFYPRRSLGKLKVAALKRLLRQFCDEDLEVVAHPCKFTDQRLNTDIIISCVDSLQTRREIYNRIRTQQPLYSNLYLDCRMGGLVGVVFCLNPHLTSDDYLKSMEGEGENAPCTAQNIIFNVLSISSTVASYIRNWSLGLDPPFKTAFDTNTFTYLFKREEPNVK